LENKAQQAESKAQQAEAAARQWQIQANEWHERLVALHVSTSWRITKPIRAIKRLLSGDFAALGRSTAAVKLEVKKILRPVFSSSIKYVFERPALRKAFGTALKTFPKLHQRLLSVALNTGVVAGGSANVQFVPVSTSSQPSIGVMSPQARQIYQDLKSAIESKSTGSA
jgi:hypothetical protein